MLAKNTQKPSAKQTSGSNHKKANNTAGAHVSSAPNAFKSYLNNHLKVSKLSIKDQLDRPFASFFTCSVIGIALVLPTLLAILLSNIQSTDIDWDGSAQITLFLKKDISALDAGVIADQLEKKDNVESSHFVSKQAALIEFKARFAMDSVIDYLDDNPLPHAIIISPSAELANISHIEALKDRLLKIPEVESALLDVLWVQRLQSISSFVEKAIYLVAIMLAIAVLLILGNTIRLAIENRKEEIAVLKLVGGTTPFICRPFIYMGMFFGLGGSIIAIILIHIILAILYGPVEELAASYQSDFDLSGLNFESTLLLLVIGATLGWLGSWLAVRKHLDEIEPT